MEDLTLDAEKVSQSASELLKATKTSKEPRLLDDPDPVLLHFSFKLVPSVENKTIKVKLPHSIYRDDQSVALFVKDQDRKDREWEKTVFHYQDLLKAKGITVVSEIIPLKALKLEYKTFESKLHLSNKHDVFLADESIIRLLPSLLGRHFYGRKKNPLQVNLKAQNLKKEIQFVLDNTRCILSGRGSSCTCIVGHEEMEPSQIAENIMAAAQQIGKNIPGGPNNVRNFIVKTRRTKAFSIYLDKGLKTEVQLPPKKRKLEDEEAEEITTLIGAKVKVLPSGVVRVIKDGDRPAKKRRVKKNGAKGKKGKARKAAMQRKQKMKST